MSLDLFHPAVCRWFTERFPGGPSAPQRRGWPAIRSGRHTLIAAPTGSGKTLAAFLSAIDELVRQGAVARLPDVTRVVYVSPLKALGNDVRKNLEEPLAAIRAELARLGRADVEIRTAVRTGDTSAAERQAMLRRPPHILVTTPESLFILLAAERGREMLQSVRTVIVDEIHAVADDKRGSHLALTLERLEHLAVHGTSLDRRRSADGAQPTLLETEPGPPRHAGRAPVRIGLSATQRPIEEIARFLVGTRRAGTEGGDPGPDCVIVDEGHARDMELAVEIPRSPLSALLSNEVWEELYDRLAELILENRTTLVFVNTRRLAERVAHHLSKRLGEEAVTSHHGSLSRERRLDAEIRLKSGRLRALVATASLALGIDIGAVDLVCQLGSPHAIAALLQRVGRSGRRLGALARGRLFALSRDELIECAALLLSAREGLLDRLQIPERPLDILAQQIVAAAATRDWSEDELFALVRGAYPFRGLGREDFDEVVRMLADGYATRRGRRAAWIHHDAINSRIRARRGARLAVVSSGGAIPDTADFQVVLEPEGTLVGTLNEDFAIESMAGDIFQLGNASWRILRVASGRVLVEDARGKPPTIPFWLGEAPARTAELSGQVSRLRAEVERRLPRSRPGAGEGVPFGPGEAAAWLEREVGLQRAAAVQIEEYLEATKRALTVIPTQETLVLERFFDEAGGMQLVVHAPFGGRINRAWGLALRKRFCRSFNFELQAAANEDAIVLSLGPQHSFPLIDVFNYLKAATARELLVQALLAAPMFQTRWRWNVGRALGVLRQRNGRKVPPQLVRMRSDDLLAAAFPQAAACLEHIVGDIEIPDHPLVRQTVQDCLVEAMDIEGLEALLGRLQRGELRLVARDVPEPSPLAHEILNARPYAFLDDAPAEERRTLAVSTRRSLEFREADDLGTLDQAAIERVRREAWPEPADRDEAHDALGWLGLLTEAEARPWLAWLAELAAERRAARLRPAGGLAAAGSFWVAAERLPEALALYPGCELEPRIEPPARARGRSPDRAEALVEVLRGRMEGLGPVTAGSVATCLGLKPREVEAALIALEGEGLVLRGRFTPPPAAGGNGPETVRDPGGAALPVEWCHRRLLARIHRLTVERLRPEIEPATPAEFMRFLFAWQHVSPERRLAGPRGTLEVLRQLHGFEAPAADWEREILPARLEGYQPEWLDVLSLSGDVIWSRLIPPPAANPAGETPRPRSGLVRATPIAFLLRAEMEDWLRLAPAPAVNGERLSRAGWEVYRALRLRGASFAQDLAARTGLPPARVERGLAELVSWGVVTSDGISGLRGLLRPRTRQRGRSYGRARPRQSAATLAGRWSLVREPAPGEESERPADAHPDWQRREACAELVARQLLARYGVVVRSALAREPLLPPWRELLPVLRRLEMRGEVRGGRFLDGASGEQFALPEALDLLRAVRRRGPDATTVVLSGGDPLNLTGVITPGERVPASPACRVLYRGGIPVAACTGGRTQALRDPSSAEEWRDAEALLLSRGPFRAAPPGAAVAGSLFPG